MKHISRYEYQGTKGWYVRVYYGGKTFSKLFADKKYGGQNLQKAKKARDVALDRAKQLAKITGELPTGEQRPIFTSNKANSTGVLGVSRTVRKLSSGNRHAYYQATWRDERGTQRNRSFSVAKYGEDEAFRQAVLIRHKKMKQMHGERYEKMRKKPGNHQLPTDKQLGR